MGLSYVGCFVDKRSRDLTPINMNTSPKACFKAAREKGYEFVSLQWRGQCFGGNSVGKYGNRPDKECNTACSAEKGMKCGGGWRNSVWFTGHLTFQKHLNYCVTSSGKDLAQTKFKNVELNECMAECTRRPTCSAVEWYAKGWQGTRCFLLLTGFDSDRAVKSAPGRRWRDAECYPRTGTFHEDKQSSKHLK